MDAIQKARELDPRSPVVSTSLARQHYVRRELERAREEYANAIELDSTFVVAHIGQAITLAALGRADEALAASDRAKALLGLTPPLLQGLDAYVHGRAGRADLARATLRRLEGMERDGYVPAPCLTLAALGAGDTDGALHWLEVARRQRSNVMLSRRKTRWSTRYAHRRASAHCCTRAADRDRPATGPLSRSLLRPDGCGRLAGLPLTCGSGRSSLPWPHA